MLSPSRTLSKPGWLMALLTIALIVGASGVLMFMFKDGPPSRLEFSVLLATLAVVPVLVRWQAGWFILFLALPWVSLVRRVYLEFDPSLVSYSYDATALLPDAILALTALGCFLTQRGRRREASAVDDKWLRVPMGLFAGLCVIAIFNPFMSSLPAGVNGFRVFTLWIALYFITPIAIRSKAQIQSWISATLILGSLAGLYGTYQYLVGFPSFDLMWAEGYNLTNQVIGEAMRPFSTFSFSSTFSHYMVVGCLLGVTAFSLKHMGAASRMMSPFFIACMLTGLALTFVRSSYLGLFAGIVVGVVLASSPTARWKRMGAVALAVGMLVTVMPKGANEAYQPEATAGQLVAQRVFTLAEPTRVGSMQARFDAWNYVLSTSFEMPIGRGLGLGAAGRFSHNFGAAATAYTESQYFTILAELGWPGLALFLWIVGYGFALSVRVYDRLEDPDLKRIARGCIMLQVGISVIGFTGGVVLYTIPGSAFYWTSLGLVMALPRLDTPKAPEVAA